MASGEEKPPLRDGDNMSHSHISSEPSSSTLDLEKRIARRYQSNDLLEEHKKQPSDDHSTTDTETESDHDDEQPSHTNNFETTTIPSNPLSKVLSRVLTRKSTNPTAGSGPPPPPPDGGLPAWTAVACSHLIIMNTWGFINSWAMFQLHYLNDSPALYPHNTQSSIAWIGSIQIFLLFFIGTLTGRLTDAGYFKQIYTLGAVMQVVGIFATSWAVDTGYWALFLAQGVCVGIGNGCLFCPTMANVSTYFEKRRALAIAIVASGSGTGGLIYPSMMRELVPRVGFAWAVRCMGFIVLFNVVVGGLFLKRREGLGRGRGIKGWADVVEWRAWREIEYTFYAVGTWFVSIPGSYRPFFVPAALWVTGWLSLPLTQRLCVVLNG